MVDSTGPHVTVAAESAGVGAFIAGAAATSIKVIVTW